MGTNKRALGLALKQIKIDEGCNLSAYQDTVGVWTIGYGHTKDVKQGDRITQIRAESFLMDDVTEALRDARTLPINFDDLNYVRQAVMINMTFNLGKTKLLAFKRTLLAISIRDFNNAALYMLQSKWAKQVKGRAIRLAEQMRTGVE